MKSFLLFPMKDLKKRPLSFLTSFLICMAGMFITFSMLFMQFGAYQAQIKNAEQTYHICLPNLQKDDIEKINNLSYVETVSGFQYEGNYTAYIRLKNNDPYELKNQCGKIIKDIDLDKTEAYANNSYYSEYGVQDNWINQEYFDLATTFFYGEVIILILPFILFTIAGFYFSIRIHIKNYIDEYATLRTFGIKVNQLLNIIVFQYSIIFLLANLISLFASFLLLKVISNYTHSTFTDNFLLVDHQIPINESIITIILSYALFLIMVQGCRSLLKQDIKLMLNKSQEYSVSYKKRANCSFSGELGIMRYNTLYMKRSSHSLLTTALKNLILFILPFVFVALSASVYGMREQANTSDYDYGIFYSDPYEVTDEIINHINENDLVKSVETMHSYGDGTYGGAYIYCVDGKEDECKIFIENIAKENLLLFTDNYHNAMLVKKQSNFFSIFYLIQAVILFMASINISLSDANFNYLKRTKEFAIIRSMGLCSQEIFKLYYPELIITFLSFMVSIVFSFSIWTYYFGIPYLKPVYILIILFVFAAIYVIGHLNLCRVHWKKLIYGSLSEKMKEVV